MQCTIHTVFILILVFVISSVNEIVMCVQRNGPLPSFNLECPSRNYASRETESAFVISTSILICKSMFLLKKFGIKFQIQSFERSIDLGDYLVNRANEREMLAK